MKINSKWITQAINIIKSGFVNKCENNGIIVYRVNNIIRIDIKDNVEVEE